MKRIILIALCLMCIAGTASAYQLYLSCPESVQVGLVLQCSIDSNFPAGTTFDVALYQSGYTATAISRQSVTIQDNQATQYKLFDTQGLPGGQYKVEIQSLGSYESRLSSDSTTLQLPKLLDRSGDITITSPMTQSIDEALRIEGSIVKAGNDGVEIEVRGPDGVVFGPQWVGTKIIIQSGAGVFTQRVAVTSPGEYDVTFRDAKGYVGVVTFTVPAPRTTTPTTIPTTTPVITTRPPTTVPTTLPTPTPSPLSPVAIVAALGIVGILSVVLAKKH
ncbi:MAG: hypothetical protein NTZ37_04360 [Methanoregula sp.]|nr:hypothetical protein [Methanoregula sp.]